MSPLISDEQTKLVESRFRKGVLLADYVPTFMACERVIDEEGRYIASSMSRRRAEWHGDTEQPGSSSSTPNNNNKDKDKNTFVPWRAIFTDSSLKPEYRNKWKSIIVGGGNDDDNSSNNYVTFVHEYVPTGALLEARFFRFDDCSESSGSYSSSQQQVSTLQPSKQFRLIQSTSEIQQWWKENGEYVSHEQFFPPGLRMTKNKKLPETLLDTGWESKMQRRYG